MTKYRIENTIVDTDKASVSWEGASRWNGSNMINIHTGSQWHDQTLYRSRKGRYYVVNLSSVSGERDYAEWLSPEEAARWLMLNDDTIPDDLAAAADNISE